mmetsp:Transcript_19703/g.25512  ORF Transcript_19703/g.25512 Transcript_19703/m.25512 type:complete len:451 (+) Transcript_19703:56-1408(+)
MFALIGIMCLDSLVKYTNGLSFTGVPDSALVIGGSGRVGGATVRWLERMGRECGIPLKLAVGGRSIKNFQSMKDRWRFQSRFEASEPAIDEVEFFEIDINDPNSLRNALQGHRLIVHTAGPFQQIREPKILDAILAHGEKCAYVDVCDETELCRIAHSKDRERLAINNEITAIISAGIWPGISAIMARQAIDMLQAQYNTSKFDLDFDFFTSGTGGAGPTIVSATFLLLCTPALNFDQNGQQIENEPWTLPKIVDFGPQVGKRCTRLLDCPEIATLSYALQNEQNYNMLASASRFATAPNIWNQLFGTTKALLPPSLLANRDTMQRLAVFSDPIVRAVDSLVGSKNAMLITATDRSSSTRTTTRTSQNDSNKVVYARHVHEDLEAAVGIATAAFALHLLHDDNVKPGIRFPAELSSEHRDAILTRVLNAPGTLSYDLFLNEAAEKKSSLS